MTQAEKTIYVYENWRAAAPSLVGILRTSFVRGVESFSFEYAPEWLSSFESAYPLDPDLSLYKGRQYAPLDKKLFGLFADSCPDRWGRLLMTRKEAIEARKPFWATNAFLPVGTTLVRGYKLMLSEGFEEL